MFDNMKSFSRKLIYMLLILPMLMLSAGCGGDEDFEFSNDFNAPSPVVADDIGIPAPIKSKSEGSGDDASKDEPIVLSEKTVRTDVDAGGRKSPFVPYRERNLTYESMNFGDLPLPPGEGEMDTSLASLITAKVTGILFEDESPSAIINVLESDYLVKPGDKVETFEIEAITKDYVAIKTGTNVFRAKVGDIVDGELYGTGVYNLGHRFAGTYNPANDDDIVIVQTKKKDAAEQKKEPVGLSDMELPPVPEKVGAKLKAKQKALEDAGELDLPSDL